MDKFHDILGKSFITASTLFLTLLSVGMLSAILIIIKRTYLILFGGY